MIEYTENEKRRMKVTPEDIQRMQAKEAFFREHPDLIPPDAFFELDPEDAKRIGDELDELFPFLKD